MCILIYFFVAPRGTKVYLVNPESVAPQSGNQGPYCWWNANGPCLRVFIFLFSQFTLLLIKIHHVCFNSHICAGLWSACFDWNKSLLCLNRTSPRWTFQSCWLKSQAPILAGLQLIWNEWVVKYGEAPCFSCFLVNLSLFVCFKPPHFWLQSIFLLVTSESSCWMRFQSPGIMFHLIWDPKNEEIN